MRQWSEQQAQIFNWFETGRGNALVRARAGTGKTTTIIEGVRRAWEPRALVAAFNKRIADELTKKVGMSGGRVEAKTLHSIGYGFVRKRVDGVQIDQYRGSNIAMEVCSSDAPPDFVKLVARVASLGKSVNYKATPGQLLALAIEHNHTVEDELDGAGWTDERVANYAHACMQAALVVDEYDPKIDFDDMIYLPVALGWAFPRYDLIVVDEAQDMNDVQLELALRVARGRIAVVGDDRQAIYGFRGANSNALDSLKSSLMAQEFGLTTTYRCGKNIVAYAKTLVPDFQAAATNPDGEIVSMEKNKALDIAAPGDFIISRTNAPLASVCLSLLRMSKPARIEGRDIGATLAAIVKKRKATSVEELESKLFTWKTKEIAKAIAKLGDGAKRKIETVTDQYETIIALAEDVGSVNELLELIERMFTDGDTMGRQIMCSTIHKAKGLEADRVFVLRDTLYPGKDSRDKIEEQNLDYVAATRAKTLLVWLNGVK